MMQLGHHLRRIWIIALVEPQCVPAVLSPVLPVLDQDVDRDLPFAKFGSRIQNLLLAGVALAALPETVCPTWQQRSSTGQIPILSNHLGRFRSIEKVVINAFTHLGV